MTSDTAATAATAGERLLEAAWRQHRTYLVALATRVLADPAEAEDAVQDAFDRLARVPIAEISDVRGWLAVVVRRLCLDRLRSAHARRESMTGRTVPEDARAVAASGAADPADRVTLDEQVQLALAVVLDRLSPAERSAFVLHDVFGFPFDAIAEILGRTSAACRQLASRARRAIRTDPPVPSPRLDVTEHELVVERFIAACAGGDLSELVSLLDPDVSGDAVLIGFGPFAQIEGAELVATRLLHVMGPDSASYLEPLPGDLDDDDAGAAVFAALADGTRGVLRFEIANGRITLIHGFVLATAAFEAHAREVFGTDR